MVYAKFYSKLDDLETIIILPVVHFDHQIGYVQRDIGPSLISLEDDEIEELYGDFRGYISDYALAAEIDKLKQWESPTKKLLIR